MKINVSDLIEQKAYDKVVEMLVEFNKIHVQNHENDKPIEIIVRNDFEEIIGGLYGRSIWGTLEIKTFVVKSENRNQGIGSRLMMAAEHEALKRNCSFISLDTFSFQAPGFYEKIGFKKIGIELDFPKGHAKYYFRKELKPFIL